MMSQFSFEMGDKLATEDIVSNQKPVCEMK